ncbi:TPA: hypothetical protein JIQ06_002523 [Acinetobacter baumannii]|nr:hypothetical protein [Acinetobacter baumannii]
MDKFEEYFRTTKHYENMLLEIARNQLSVSVFDKNGRKYRNHIVQTAYEVFQHQQAKVEELQKQLNEYIFVAETLDEMYVKEVKSSDELQKRVEWLEDRLKATDTLSKMRAAVIGSFNSQEFNARTRRKMMILKRAEQALKGEGQ